MKTETRGVLHNSHAKMPMPALVAGWGRTWPGTILAEGWWVCTEGKCTRRPEAVPLSGQDLLPFSWAFFFLFFFFRNNWFSTCFWKLALAGDRREGQQWLSLWVSISGSDLRVKRLSELLGVSRASCGDSLGFQQASISRRGPGVAALALHVGNELLLPPQEGTNEMLLIWTGHGPLKTVPSITGISVWPTHLNGPFPQVHVG